MSELRLVIREAGRDWSGTTHGSMAVRAVAALSADPATLGDLEVALERFAKPCPGRLFFAGFSDMLCDEPYDAGLVVIDRFGETLSNVAMTRPDLGPNCDSLMDRLVTLLDEPPPEPAWESFDPSV